MDIRELINHSPMSARQWSIVAIALFLNALDGYDIVAMAFGSSAVTEAFELSGVQLGWLLTSALIGIGLGSVFLAPYADRFGRTKLITIALVIDLCGLILTALAPNFALLLLFRILTGIGVGGVLVCVTVLVSEFSNLRFRGLAMALYTGGYGFGAMFCGFVAARLGPVYGWQAIFWAGAALTVVGLGLTIFFVPESAEFLASRGRMDEVSAIAKRIGVQGSASFSPRPVEKATWKELVSPAFLRTSIQLWLAFSLIMFAYYFTSQWTPKLLQEEGLTAQQGILGGIMLSFGGTIGALVYGVLTTRIDARRLLIRFGLGSAGVLVGFIVSSSMPAVMFILGIGVGLMLNACIAGLYTVTPEAYPSVLRTTGTGAAIGIARMGSTLAPILAGYLLDAGWTPLGLYTLAGAAALIAAVSLIGLRAHGATLEETAPAPVAA
ncbi:MAG: MFS transporter [Corynebacterium flavescens]|uniref:MFS transporter n=1 Tax=Corynebacterium flavescens TaxID=28028 RepID=UPI0026479293|nr:MFS transporter [Corynebacterium flavescens]MDN6551445.1 MFS transporter [Corynebacterium flavescens]